MGSFVLDHDTCIVGNSLDTIRYSVDDESISFAEILLDSGSECELFSELVRRDLIFISGHRVKIPDTREPCVLI
jgi:hypothetical protein